jgi:hypothetical protein
VEPRGKGPSDRFQDDESGICTLVAAEGDPAGIRGYAGRLGHWDGPAGLKRVLWLEGLGLLLQLHSGGSDACRSMAACRATLSHAVVQPRLHLGLERQRFGSQMGAGAVLCGGTMASPARLLVIRARGLQPSAFVRGRDGLSSTTNSAPTLKICPLCKTFAPLSSALVVIPPQQSSPTA